MVRKSSTTGIDKLRNQLLSDLQSEAEQILKQMTQQFTDDLNSTMQSTLGGFTGSAGADGSSGGTLTGLPQLLTAGLSYIFNRPSTSVTTSQTSRSLASDQQFRLSQSQAAAQAMATLAKGNKNS